MLEHQQTSRHKKYHGFIAVLIRMQRQLQKCKIVHDTEKKQQNNNKYPNIKAYLMKNTIDGF